MTEHFTSKAEGSHKSALRNQNKTAQITEKKLQDLFKQKKQCSSSVSAGNNISF